MSKTERKLIDFFNRNISKLCIMIILAFAFLSRFMLRGFRSVDMRLYLLPWYSEIVNLGGIGALGHQIGNYGIPYQTIIALLTYLPVAPVTAYKLVSCIFDVLLAVVCALIIKEVSDASDNTPAVITLSLVLMSPIVIMNSAAWGQCDSIYTFFCLLSLLLFLKGRSTGGMLAYGAAFAFKLQSVFLLPVIGLIYLKEKRCSIIQFLIVPLVLLVLSAGGILQGRGFMSAFGVYSGQVGDSKGALTWNYPGLWAIFAPEENPALDIFILPAVLIGLSFAGLFVYVLIRSTRVIEKKQWIFISFLLVYMIVILLPEMRERYGYMYEVLSIIVAIIDRKTIAGCILLHVITLITYGKYLAGGTYNMRLLASLNVLLFTAYLVYFIKEYGITQKGENSPC